MAFNLSAKSAFIVALLAFSASATPVEPISPCAAVTCSTNTFCNVINGKPVCLPISRQQKCGKAVCAPGHVCCNSSCGICTKPGGVCTQQICPDIELQPVEPAPTVDKREDIVKIEEPELPAVKPTKCGPTLCAPGIVSRGHFFTCPSLPLTTRSPAGWARGRSGPLSNFQIQVLQIELWGQACDVATGRLIPTSRPRHFPLRTGSQPHRGIDRDIDSSESESELEIHIPGFVQV
ncbi:uncharacterized protein CTHT_0074750 [Thermochaetoides thermophila DSM 1495]|uniref:Uncharacterized protein n=1 Tax=Chaetomium thermophilum (strain DSM 1495 / CBS 144.50 / IMI 039719) TaxID=759272 RepID=G0SI73_CHATD|nr:hypothetical protein CTHT_0074750 [Thermochaetoides thermophila DSM 1495]EGS17143.1 hypothetical protein CTHT_0074750 [Thermochaetoides thermophila DSM 1495]